MNAQIAVHEREAWIIGFLQDARRDENDRSIRKIWEAASQPRSEGGLGDTATLPTYHRTINKMTRRGQLKNIDADDGGPSRFAVTSWLSPLNTFTLADLESALWELSAPEALAMWLEAVDYYESRADDVLARAAEGLMREDPRKLILQMLQDAATHVDEDLDDLRDPETAEPKHRARTEDRLKSLHRFVYGELGLGGHAWKIPSMEAAIRGENVTPISWQPIRDALAEHVFGEAFVEKVHVSDQPTPALQSVVTAGSDGSSHAGFVRGVPAPMYAEAQGRLILTFNNSVAYVDLPPDAQRVPRFPYHGVPMTRSALEDPSNRGMIISRPWFTDLTDSEYEHMKKAALDVVQFRVDERLMAGNARAYGTSMGTSEAGLLPKPNVLLRDGTVTPQERELQHYERPNAYGEIVQEGINLSYSLLRSVSDSRSRVFGGVVKSTQLKTFSRIINWYIQSGSRITFGAPIDAAWDLTRASHVTDTVAVTRLLRALPKIDAGDSYYRTCVVVRPFPAMVTSLRTLERRGPDDWLDWFCTRQKQQIQNWQQYGGEQPFFATTDVEDDPYVRMCQYADYGMFFFGKPGGDPQITFPRFEFLDAIRQQEPAHRRERVLRSATAIVTAVHDTRWSLDRDHNFFTGTKLPRLIPYVVQEAHEKCKVLGHKLEAELRQAIMRNLSELKALRGLPAPREEVDPVPFSTYVKSVRERLRGTSADRSPSDLPDELRGSP